MSHLVLDEDGSEVDVPDTLENKTLLLQRGDEVRGQQATEGQYVDSFETAFSICMKVYLPNKVHPFPCYHFNLLLSHGEETNCGEISCAILGCLYDEFAFIHLPYI